MDKAELPGNILNKLNQGVVIPALPLALDKNRKLDERRQKALIRYYLEAGAGGIAAAVHTTQFEIRSPQFKFYEPVLKLVASEVDSFEQKNGAEIIRIAGVVGKTPQAKIESRLALESKYHAVLLSLSAFKNSSNQKILQHCRAIAEIIPVIGFYLQPAVGGRILDVGFWREFAKIKNVIAIKIAPFSRYQTLDVMRGVAESGRAAEIALYTGNDDNILLDLLTEYSIPVKGKIEKMKMVGGLLGHWAVWTKTAVELLKDVQSGKFENNFKKALRLANQITDCNAAFFDSANNFKGCIVGLHEVLRRQGLLEGTWTLNENEVLSDTQLREINRVYNSYPLLNDDGFVKENLHKWLS